MVASRLRRAESDDAIGLLSAGAAGEWDSSGGWSLGSEPSALTVTLWVRLNENAISSTSSNT
ncbi:Uncharacterised protein [Mycobacterium tuberculosis]|nr:Uncharacterised protein [Mycobacterium tuberculosis]